MADMAASRTTVSRSRSASIKLGRASSTAQPSLVKALRPQPPREDVAGFQLANEFGDARPLFGTTRNRAGRRQRE